MSSIKSFEDIKSWQKGRILNVEIYKITNKGDFQSDFGLKDQIRRASVSITSNIAEGFERGSRKEFLQFLSYSKGSCGEVKSQLFLALDLGYIQQEEFEKIRNIVIEISSLLHGLIKYLKTSEVEGIKYKVEEEEAEYFKL